jgi:hypothetical protein
VGVDRRFVVLAALAASTAIDCNVGTIRPPTVENANAVIQICRTPVQVVRKEFGEPDEIGMVGGMVTNEWRAGWRGGNRRMIVAFSYDIAVDVAVVPVNTVVELKNRCLR